MNHERIENALLTIACIKRALADGVKHYNKKGKLLLTPKEIAEALLKDGCIELEEPWIGS